VVGEDPKVVVAAVVVPKVASGVPYLPYHPYHPCLPIPLAHCPSVPYHPPCRREAEAE